MRNTVKYIAFRVLFLLTLILGVGVYYEVCIYPNVIKKEGWISDLYNKSMKENPTVLYFGASPNKSKADSDTDNRSISQMTSKYINEIIYSIDAGALHAGVFAKMIERIPDSSSVHTVIMDLNIRSFGIQWLQSPLENSIQKSMAFWNNRPGVINRMNISLKNYNYVSPFERESQIEYHNKFEAIQIGSETKNINNWSKELNGEKSIHFIEKFAFNIDEKNARTKQYDEVVKICKKKNLNLILVILPEDIESMQNQVGIELSNLIVENADFLVKRYSATNAKVVNLSESLKHDRFYEDFPTEHYDQIGRDIVAKKISEQVLQLKNK